MEKKKKLLLTDLEKYYLAIDSEVLAHFKYLCLYTFHFQNTCQVYTNAALPPTQIVLQILSTEFLAPQFFLKCFKTCQEGQQIEQFERH